MHTNFWRHWWVIFFLCLCFLQGVVNTCMRYFYNEMCLLKICLFRGLTDAVDNAEQAKMFHSMFELDIRWKCVTDCCDFFSCNVKRSWTKSLFPASTERWANSDICDALSSLHAPTPRSYLTTPCPYWEQVSFWIIYSIYFCVYLLSATV